MMMKMIALVINEESSDSNDTQEMLNDIGSSNFGENQRNSQSYIL